MGRSGVCDGENHKNRIDKKFRGKIDGKKIVGLFIEDIYNPMEETLMAELRRKLAPYLKLPPVDPTGQPDTSAAGTTCPP